MTETPKYIIIEKHDEIEIREYAGYIQAEVNVTERGYKTAIEKGFGILAGYIFGANIARQKIEMTTPVKVALSEKIAMTTPVTVKGSDLFTVAFVMPSEYSLETLPVPKDGRIRFNAVPSHRMAAVRFTGYFNSGTIKKNKALLTRWLEDHAVKTEGDFVVAGYNPPWVPGFLARNEVMVQVI